MATNIQKVLFPQRRKATTNKQIPWDEISSLQLPIWRNIQQQKQVLEPAWDKLTISLYEKNPTIIRNLFKNTTSSITQKTLISLKLNTSATTIARSLLARSDNSSATSENGSSCSWKFHHDTMSRQQKGLRKLLISTPSSIAWTKLECKWNKEINAGYINERNG